MAERKPSGGIPLGTAVVPADARPARGVRVVLDARALQDPEHAPVTAAYLHGLLSALDAEPLEGETFVILLAAEGDDPTERYGQLEVVGRRLLPPIRVLGSARSAVDPFLVRGAVAGAGWRPHRTGSTGAVHHTTGAAVPVASELPVVAALLDLAPWELPALRRRRGPAGFGRRLRARSLAHADAVLVGTEAIARRTQRLLRLTADRIHVIPLAPTLSAATVRTAVEPIDAAAPTGDERVRLGLATRYAVVATRFDARHDTRTFVDALTLLEATRESGPDLCVIGASPDDRARIATIAVRAGVADRLAYAPSLPPDRLASLVAGARATIIPALADATALAAIDSLALGVPVVASAVGALPEVVGPAGILVRPGATDRLAVALAAVLADDAAHALLVAAARSRSAELATWSSVAWHTRTVWSRVARDPRLR